jgi:hypothetical protein
VYYLRKEEHEEVIPQIEKTDGTVMPERQYVCSDRALYKSTTMSRFYRKTYPRPNGDGLKLYQAKRLSTILSQRQRLYEYCGEWFDVYDENGKVDID